jgi:putative ABC transport system permease protein
MREWLARLRDWFRRDQLECELNEELQLHRQLLQRDGQPARRLGNRTSIVEAARERWSVPWLDHLQQDVRYALRSVRRSPGFTLTAILTLGLGLGANTTMYGVIDRLMFRPYPYMRDPSTVHRVYWRSWNRGTLQTEWNSEYKHYLDLVSSTSSFSQHAAFTNRVLAVGSGEAARERSVEAVSASFFEFFHAPPALGRYFSPNEDATPRGADVAVLGFAFWQSEFGGRDVRGQVIKVGNFDLTIIGVAPDGFVGVNDNDPTAVYLPITTFAGNASDRRNASTYFTAYYWRFMEIMVRRKPGVSVAQASADASQAAVRSWNLRRDIEHDLAPAASAKPSAVVSALKVDAGPDPNLEAKTALWVGAVATIVLLIACANVANMQLARSLGRERETAIRLALGVRRGRLVRQSIVESLVLSLIAGAAGLLIAQWSGPVVRRLLTTDAIATPVFTDWRTLALAFAVATAVGIVTGLVPALVSGRDDLALRLRTGGRAGLQHHSRARTALLVTQGALSVVLLIGAALFVKSLGHVERMRLGYDVDRVLVVGRSLRGVQLDDSGRAALRRTLVEAAQAIPGVEAASWALTFPFEVTNVTGLWVPGVDSVARLGQFTYQAATPDYFKAMGTRIIRGRGLTSEDRQGAPRVAVVSQSMAAVLWPRENAVGKCMHVFADSLPCTTVVGVAEDVVQEDLARSQRFHYYLSLDQFAPGGGGTMVLRMRGDPSLEAERVRAALQRVMPGASYVTTQPFREIVNGETRSWRLGATMFSAFGVLALLVAAVGLYGVISYNVAQRTRELGVRMALGAQAMDVVRLIAGQGLMFAGAGVAIGLVGARVAAPFLQPVLFRQSATDPLIYLGVSLTIVVVALMASATPAFRATRADPNIALRSD